MAILPKDYLSVTDVGSYLNDLGFHFDLKDEMDYKRLCNDIYDLVIEDKLKAVFKCYDSNNKYYAYYFLNYELTKVIFLGFQQAINVKGLRGFFKKQHGSGEVFEGDAIIIQEDKFITIHNLYIPKLQLDSLFENTKKQRDDKLELENIIVEKNNEIEDYNKNNELLNRRIDELEQLLQQSKQQLEKSNQQVDKNKDPFKKQGVTPELLKAKVVANAHAQYLLSKDHDNKLRIGDICESVWNYLVDTKYRKELPNKRESLKGWLNDMPEYISRAGAPKK